MSETITRVVDENDNLIYEEDDDGYRERNTYNENNKLVRCEVRYPNGIVEVEHFNES